ncbi:MAG: helix-turn-helix domain-containing protein [Actinomycetota bacterium]
MGEIAVIDDVDTARAALDPFRSRILAALTRPGSASTVAEELGEPRQKVNHHVRALADAGLIELVAERPRRGLTERVFQASDEAIVLAPSLTGVNAPRVPDDSGTTEADQLSSRYLLAVATRLVDEVGSLVRRARDARRPLATLTIDTDIRFASAADRAEFTRRLAHTLRELAAEYHDEAAPGGRWHRLMVFAHPRPSADDTPDPRTPESTREDTT